MSIFILTRRPTQFCSSGKKIKGVLENKEKITRSGDFVILAAPTSRLDNQ
jgi:hypothetical protein